MLHNAAGDAFNRSAARPVSADRGSQTPLQKTRRARPTTFPTHNSRHTPRETHMKALVWHGKGDVRCDTVPDPKIEEPTDVIIKVTSTCICGSDLHLYDA